MTILHLSDTHSLHGFLPDEIFANTDVVIHSGDCSNNRDPYRNNNEALDFIEWYKSVPVANKIYVAGNHDTSIAAGLVRPKFFEDNGIIYLQDQEVVIDGIKFYGSPWTPSFGNWAFMKKRHKLHDLWAQIPDDTDVLITHGPPKGVRDLTLNRDNELEQVGDISLVKRIMNLKLQLHCFGHIHDTDNIRNRGSSIYSGIPTIFSNAACVTDGKNQITSHGNRINLLP